MLRLLLPALIPSWRFFDHIAPSPRIQFALLARPDDAPMEWWEFRPRPARLSCRAMLQRLFWNPQWNESLYLTNCAERIIEEPSARVINELLARIANAIGSGELANVSQQPPCFIVRILVLHAGPAPITQQVMFTSSARRLDDRRARDDA